MDTVDFDAEPDDGFHSLADKITRESEFMCNNYKDRCVRRRIAIRMRARGTPTYSQYADLLDSDAAEYGQLIDMLTVNVTRFFRNPTTFRAAALQVIPPLWQRDGPIDVWSAGSASGEEAYSLAALFYDHACDRDETAALARVKVLGSDIDRGSLESARRAMYLPVSFSDTARESIDRLFPQLGDRRTVTPAIRALTSFERRDILQDPPAPLSFDLIACRNVVIYLGRDSQERLLDSLYESLRPGGFLIMGHVETLFGKARRHLVPVELRERIYRKPL